MVNGFTSGDSWRHVVTPETAAMLTSARRRHGWSFRLAARNVGVSVGMIAELEAGRRAPSVTVAYLLIENYELSQRESAQLLADAVEGVGRDWRSRAGR